tara:strand:- start:15 stop:179 length:165 start_codon:yes stop_codon:yes gene_type:complete
MEKSPVKECRMEKENKNGRMDVFIRENLLMGKYMDMDKKLKKMEKYTLVTGVMA